MNDRELSRRDFCKGSLLLAYTASNSTFPKVPAEETGRDALGSEPGRAQALPEEIIYTGVSLEFVQLWDHLERIRQVKELGLGNLVVLAATFHVGSTEEEKLRWKKLYPALAEQIDQVPKSKILKEVGSPAILPIPKEALIEEVRACREYQLYFGAATYLMNCKGEECASLIAKLAEEGGKYFLTYSVLGEHTSILNAGRPSSIWKAEEGIDPGKMNLQTFHDWFVSRDRKAVLEVKKAGAPFTDNVEATAQFRLALAAGVDIPVLELVPYEPLGGLAAVRGAAKAYGSPFWGVCFAFGWYRPPVDLSVPNRARIAYNLFYAGGARLFYDLNYYFHVYSLGAGWFSDTTRPPARMGEKEYKGFDDPICVAGRKVLQDHYTFVQFHDRPKGGPRVKLGFALGHLDAYTGWINQSHVSGVREPDWEAGDAEKTWQYFHRLYDVEPWYAPPLKNYWQSDPLQTLKYGTPPCGQVDIVPVEAPLETLQSYSCLVFLGWNTMTEDLYEKLKHYVQAGGRLLMSLPQLSRQVERKADLQLLRGGDYRDLFGARIVGAGERSASVRFVQASAFRPYQLPLGAAYQEGIRLAKIDLGRATVLAATPEGSPVLLENLEGKGFAYLLTTWEYPGLHLPSFMTDLLRTISNGEQDEIAVEGEAVFYAVYGKGGEATEDLSIVYLVNRSYYGLPQYARVAVKGNSVPVQVGGYDMRIVWKGGDLVISPFDKFVKVEKLQPRSGGYTVSMAAEEGDHRLQVASLGREIGSVLLDGKLQVLARDLENTASFENRMGGKHQLTVEVR
ncbi:MAG: hypothetical protein HY717_01550 [Planctomycetes bacterium]|nr:hypothetical protein [Planctomycetota bacterium]